MSFHVQTDLNKCVPYSIIYVHINIKSYIKLLLNGKKKEKKKKNNVLNLFYTVCWTWMVNKRWVEDDSSHRKYQNRARDHLKKKKVFRRELQISFKEWHLWQKYNLMHKKSDDIFLKKALFISLCKSVISTMC